MCSVFIGKVCLYFHMDTSMRVCELFNTLNLFFYKSGSKREIIRPRGAFCPSPCGPCPDDNSQIRGWRISAASLAAAAAAFLPSKTCPSSLSLFCSYSPSSYISPAFPPSLLFLNSLLSSHHFLSLSLLLCVLCLYSPAISLSSLSVPLVHNKPVWGAFQVCLE